MIAVKEAYRFDDEDNNSFVVLEVNEYEKLLAKYEELVEDLQDLALIAERRDEPRISLDILMQKLEQDGVL